ncbi:kinesin motor domain containing protein [Babesia ovis]|uniref:Kinesin-like protein n=1 Tax=Babesia ovis TaxID=5869 RepID=A0A9W5TD69_BABOV|nr:kinesin motor domain containing protein [Babesia ovis]
MAGGNPPAMSVDASNMLVAEGVSPEKRSRDFGSPTRHRGRLAFRLLSPQRQKVVKRDSSRSLWTPDRGNIDGVPYTNRSAVITDMTKSARITDNGNTAFITEMTKTPVMTSTWTPNGKSTNLGATHLELLKDLEVNLRSNDGLGKDTNSDVVISDDEMVPSLLSTPGKNVMDPVSTPTKTFNIYDSLDSMDEMVSRLPSPITSISVEGSATVMSLGVDNSTTKGSTTNSIHTNSTHDSNTVRIPASTTTNTSTPSTTITNTTTLTTGPGKVHTDNGTGINLGDISVGEVLMQYYTPDRRRDAIDTGSPWRLPSSVDSLSPWRLPSSVDTGHSNMKVVVRVRPIDTGVIPAIKIVDNVVELHKPGNSKSVLGSQKPKVYRYAFDGVFDAGATQEQVFEATSKELVSKAFEGINGTVFAYGCTSAGKTYTIVGDDRVDGIVQMTLHHMYQYKQDVPETLMTFSFMEVYNESVFDLLAPVQKPLDIQENNGKVKVALLTSAPVDDLETALGLLAKGIKARKRALTDANRHSSRSHAIIQIGVQTGAKKARITFVDLAGSERSGTTEVNGERAKESGYINQSLLALANCISALSDGSSSRIKVKYRDSKLTLILKNVLFSNAAVVMIAAIHPGTQFIHETNNSLMYARRAKDIRVAYDLEDCTPCSYDYEAALKEAYNTLVLVGQALSDETRHTVEESLKTKSYLGYQFLLNLLNARLALPDNRL